MAASHQNISETPTEYNINLLNGVGADRGNVTTLSRYNELFQNEDEAQDCVLIELSDNNH